MSLNLNMTVKKDITDKVAGQKMQEGFIKAAEAWQENTCINFSRIVKEDIVVNGRRGSERYPAQ